MIDEKRIVIEFLEPGGFINLEHESLLINMKLQREIHQHVQSAIIFVMGIAVMAFSIIDIKKENQEMQNEAKVEEGENEENEDEENEEQQVTENAPKVDKTSLKYILIHCSIFQKINFFAIFLTYIN